MPKRAYLRLLLGVLLLATVAYANWPATGLPENTTADAVLVEKSARRLTLLRDGQPLKTYRVSLGRRPFGPKVQEGDRRTPEGEYIIDYRNQASGYHRALHVSYPDPDDLTPSPGAGRLAWRRHHDPRHPKSLRLDRSSAPTGRLDAGAASP
jgi:hypothetical protein